MTAALVAAALLVGTAVSVWQAVRAVNALESERQTRAALDLERAQVNGKISDALVELAGRREQARAAGPADGKHWADFQDAAQRAETLVGSDLADPALVQRVRDLLGLFRQDEKDRRMAAQLAEIGLESRAARPGPPAAAKVGSAFAAAFREYGLPVTDLPVVQAASRVRVSGIRDGLLAALDAWSALDARAGGTAWMGLLAVAQAADDHPWRRECRDAVLRGDRPSLVQLARREDSPRQPAGAVLLLAGTLAVPSPGRPATGEELSVTSGLLEKAGVWHPGDASIAFALAAWFPSRSQGRDAVAVAREHIDRLKKDAAGPARLAAEYANLGRLLEEKTDWSGRTAAYRQAVHLMPGRADYRALLVKNIVNADERIAACSDWIQFGPSSPLPYQLRAAVYYARQQWPQALADLIKVTELAPQDASAWSGRAETHDRMHQYEEALAAYMKAIEAAQREAQNPACYWHGRALTYRNLGQWDKAIADATQAVDLDPKKGSTGLSAATSTAPRGTRRKPLRITTWPSRILRQTMPGIGLYQRAELYEQLGRWNKAIADWTEMYGLRAMSYRSRGALVRLLVTCPDHALRNPRRAHGNMPNKTQSWGPGMSGSTWPWPTRNSATTMKPRSGTTGPSSGWKRTRGTFE